MREIPDDMTAMERLAFDQLLPPERRTGVLADDLAAAAAEAMRRRRENTQLGKAVLGVLYRHVRSWRQVGAMTGIPWSTARSWHKPTPGSG